MTEAAILAAIRLRATELGVTLFRNNVGAATDTTGRLVRYGLFPGSSDLIGWTVRDGRALFTAIEVKRPGQKPTAEQAAFILSVQAAGGIAGVVTSVADLETLVRDAA